MYEFHLLKNETINFFIDSGYYIDYQVNKGKALCLICHACLILFF